MSSADLWLIRFRQNLRGVGAYVMEGLTVRDSLIRAEVAEAPPVPSSPQDRSVAALRQAAAECDAARALIADYQDFVADRKLSEAFRSFRQRRAAGAIPTRSNPRRTT